MQLGAELEKSADDVGLVKRLLRQRPVRPKNGIHSFAKVAPGSSVGRALCVHSGHFFHSDVAEKELLFLIDPYSDKAGGNSQLEK